MKLHRPSIAVVILLVFTIGTSAQEAPAQSEVTEVQRLKAELIQTKGQLLQASFQEIQRAAAELGQQRQALIDDIKKTLGDRPDVDKVLEQLGLQAPQNQPSAPAPPQP